MATIDTPGCLSGCFHVSPPSFAPDLNNDNKNIKSVFNIYLLNRKLLSVTWHDLSCHTKINTTRYNDFIESFLQCYVFSAIMEQASFL